MKRRSHVRTSKRRPKVSPFRRLEEELANARKACVNAVDKYVEAIKGLGDALGYVDRLMPQSKNSGDGWTAADVKRLTELRKLANG